jgi:hypothetical protein
LLGDPGAKCFRGKLRKAEREKKSIQERREMESKQPGSTAEIR